MHCKQDGCWIKVTGQFLWWDEYVLDRTIDYSFTKVTRNFGRNIFAAYLPTTIAAILMLFITYKLHEEF